MTLYGKIGFNNAKELLNGICSIYKNDEYAISARSITEEDINGVTGYVPEISESLSKEGLDNDVKAAYQYKNTIEMPNITDYNDNKYKMIFKGCGNNGYKNYWFPSRFLAQSGFFR